MSCHEHHEAMVNSMVVVATVAMAFNPFHAFHAFHVHAQVTHKLAAVLLPTAASSYLRFIPEGDPVSPNIAICELEFNGTAGILKACNEIRPFSQELGVLVKSHQKEDQASEARPTLIGLMGIQESYQIGSVRVSAACQGNKGKLFFPLVRLVFVLWWFMAVYRVYAVYGTKSIFNCFGCMHMFFLQCLWTLWIRQ